MSLLEKVSSTLEAAGIRHALIGALALSAYGVNRATVDLDLFAADTSCLKPELWAALRSRGIHVEIRMGDWTDPLAGVVRFQAPRREPSRRGRREVRLADEAPRAGRAHRRDTRGPCRRPRSPTPPSPGEGRPQALTVLRGAVMPPPWVGGR